MKPERTWFPVSSGILSPEHFRRIGPAIWVFLWFIHQERKPKDDCPTGLVGDGQPITYQHIAAELGIPFGTVRRYVEALESGGYIRAERVGTAGAGRRYFITNPIRWTLKRVLADEQSHGERVSTDEQSVAERVLTGEQTECSKSGERVLKFEHSIKEANNQVTQRTNTKPNPSVADATAIDSRHHPIRALIQKTHENRFTAKCQWDGREGRALRKLLTSNPSWTLDQISTMVTNRFDSDGVPPQRPALWIPDLGKFLAGPLDRFSKLRTGKDRRSTTDTIAEAQRLAKGWSVQ